MQILFPVSSGKGPYLAQIFFCLALHTFLVWGWAKTPKQAQSLSICALICLPWRWFARSCWWKDKCSIGSRTTREEAWDWQSGDGKEDEMLWKSRSCHIPQTTKCIEHFVLVPHSTPDTATSLQSQTIFGNPTTLNQSELSGHPFDFSPSELPQVMSIIFTKVVLILALFTYLHV